jgi:SAM-dependent methyltransferase
MLQRLQILGVRTVGLDFSLTALHAAQHHLPAHAVLLRGDAAHVPCLDCCFDGVVAQHLVEHFPSESGVLREWWRVLRPGGRIVLATPNARFPIPDWFSDPTHMVIYGADQLRDALTAAGFVGVRMTYVNPFPGHARLVRRAARNLQPLTAVPWVRAHSLTLLAEASRPVSPMALVT